MEAYQSTFAAWPIMAKKNFQDKQNLLDAMTDYWLHAVLVWIDYDHKKITEIDKRNLSKAAHDSDACIAHIHWRAVADTLFTTFLKQKYHSPKDEEGEISARYRWLLLVIERARLHGYRRFKDGKQFRVMGTMSRICPSTMKAFISPFDLPSVSFTNAENLVQALNQHNTIKQCVIVSTANQTVVKQYAGLERMTNDNEQLKETPGKGIIANWSDI